MFCCTEKDYDFFHTIKFDLVSNEKYVHCRVLKIIFFFGVFQVSPPGTLGPVILLFNENLLDTEWIRYLKFEHFIQYITIVILVFSFLLYMFDPHF